MKHNGICPCGCKREVPHGCYYRSRYCGEKYRKIMKRLGANSRPTVTGRTRLENPRTRRLEMEVYTTRGV